MSAKLAAMAAALVVGGRCSPVKVDGNSVAVKDCAFATSTGDEAGTAGGVVSGVTKGKAKFVNYSFDVKLEGKNACRLGDAMTMNGNGPNTLTPAEIQKNLGASMGKDVTDLLCKAFCWCNKEGNRGKDIIKKTEVPIDPTMA